MANREDLLERADVWLADNVGKWRDADRAERLVTALTAEVRELRVDVLWMAEKVDCVTLPTTGGRKTVRFEGFALGVKVIPTDGTDASLLSAVRRARGARTDGE